MISLQAGLQIVFIMRSSTARMHRDNASKGGEHDAESTVKHNNAAINLDKRRRVHAAGNNTSSQRLKMKEQMFYEVETTFNMVLSPEDT